MPPLLVIPALPRTADAVRGALPALPALSELLRLADASGPDVDWRSGLLRDLGAGTARVPEAVVAAAALRVPAGRNVCLAAPVHAVAGLHRVHLHAAGILSLTSDERAELAAQFAIQFGTDPRLHEAGSQWLVEADWACAADETDPACWAGAPLERKPANCAEQRLLRRLGAEVEMWLADLPLNARRRSRGQLPVNLLWMWGGGQVSGFGAVPAPAAVRLLGPAEDAWVAGCAALWGGSVLPLPSTWSGIGSQDCAVVLRAADDVMQLLDREAAWFAPALEQLRNGGLESLRLRIGRRMHHVRCGSFRRLLRRRRAWWQAVEA